MIAELIGDPEDRRFFDLEISDVNNDSYLDLLVTINSPTDGRLVVYEIPEDFRFAVFIELS